MMDFKNYTWEKRLGRRNTDRTPALKGPHVGVVFEWLTQGGIPVCFPDQWNEGDIKMKDLERLPDDIQEVHYT